MKKFFSAPTRTGQKHSFLIGKSGQEQAMLVFDGRCDGLPSNLSIEAIKALDGKIFAMLSKEEEVVLQFYCDQGRKYGVSVTIINEADPEELERATSRQQADAVLKSANSRICVTVTP